jgi:transposase-like protein
MTLIQGKDTLAGLAHEHGLSVQTLEGWRSEYLPEILHPVGLPMSESELRLGQEVQRLKAEVAALRQRCQAPDIPNW